MSLSGVSTRDPYASITFRRPSTYTSRAAAAPRPPELAANTTVSASGRVERRRIGRVRADGVHFAQISAAVYRLSDRLDRVQPGVRSPDARHGVAALGELSGEFEADVAAADDDDPHDFRRSMTAMISASCPSVIGARPLKRLLDLLSGEIRVDRGGNRVHVEHRRRHPHQ